MAIRCRLVSRELTNWIIYMYEIAVVHPVSVEKLTQEFRSCWFDNRMERNLWYYTKWYKVFKYLFQSYWTIFEINSSITYRLGICVHACITEVQISNLGKIRFYALPNVKYTIVNIHSNIWQNKFCWDGTCSYTWCYWVSHHNRHVCEFRHR